MRKSCAPPGNGAACAPRVQRLVLDTDTPGPCLRPAKAPLVGYFIFLSNACRSPVDLDWTFPPSVLRAPGTQTHGSTMFEGAELPLVNRPGKQQVSHATLKSGISSGALYVTENHSISARIGCL